MFIGSFVFLNSLDVNSFTNKSEEFEYFLLEIVFVADHDCIVFIHTMDGQCPNNAVSKFERFQDISFGLLQIEGFL